MKKTSSNLMLLKAYAKVNLGLKILGERADGYHNIETILQPINFFDIIELTVCAGSRPRQGPHPLIDFSSNLPPYDEENMCYKAANLFLMSQMVSPPTIGGVKIKLKKRVWLGAGLGGGSSCAAKVLQGMNTLFGEPLSKKELSELALKLGADVPFFLGKGPAYVEGKGEIITPLPPLTQPIWVVLIYPNFEISTRWAYENVKNYLTKERGELKVLKALFLNNKIDELARHLYNDFEPLVFDKYPELKKIKFKLLELGALGASLTGTGSCVYGIVATDKRRNLNEKKFKLAFPEFQVKLVQTI